MALPAWAIYAIITVVSTGLSLLLAPRPPKPSGDNNQQSLDESSIPVAEEGKPIPVVFGTVFLKSPNVIWYGDIGVVEIEEDVGGDKK